LERNSGEIEQYNGTDAAEEADREERERRERKEEAGEHFSLDAEEILLRKPRE
jgi:hypothetical protein